MRQRKTSTVHEDTRRSCWTFIDSYSSYQLQQGTKSFLRGRENGRQGVTHKQEAAGIRARHNDDDRFNITITNFLQVSPFTTFV